MIMNMDDQQQEHQVMEGLNYVWNFLIL